MLSLVENQSGNQTSAASGTVRQAVPIQKMSGAANPNTVNEIRSRRLPPKARSTACAARALRKSQKPQANEVVSAAPPAARPETNAPTKGRRSAQAAP